MFMLSIATDFATALFKQGCEGLLRTTSFVGDAFWNFLNRQLIVAVIMFRPNIHP